MARVVSSDDIGIVKVALESYLDELAHRVEALKGKAPTDNYNTVELMIMTQRALYNLSR